MGDPNKILRSGNSYRQVSNLAGSVATQEQLQGLPLGTVGDTATGELGVKVVIVGSGGGAGAGTTNLITTINTSATTASASSALLLDTSNRKYALIINTGANDAWISLGSPAVVGSGIYLKAGGGSYEITNANLFQGEIDVITTSSTTNIATTEGS